MLFLLGNRNTTTDAMENLLYIQKSAHKEKLDYVIHECSTMNSTKSFLSVTTGLNNTWTGIGALILTSNLWGAHGTIHPSCYPCLLAD